MKCVVLFGVFLLLARYSNAQDDWKGCPVSWISEKNIVQFLTKYSLETFDNYQNSRIRPLILCRGMQDNFLNVGTYLIDLEDCCLKNEQDQAKHPDEFEVVYLPKEKYRWVSYTIGSQLPTGAFAAGFYRDRSPLYVCLCTVASKWRIGRIKHNGDQYYCEATEHSDPLERVYSFFQILVITA